MGRFSIGAKDLGKGHALLRSDNLALDPGNEAGTSHGYQNHEFSKFLLTVCESFDLS